MSLEDPRKRAAEEKKVRIDHSDVYLENEKLAEALGSDLDTLSRRRHRQVINRDYEIKQIRESLNAMSVTKTGNSVSNVRPHTTIPAFRRLKPPPNIVKLDVHVPNNNHSDDDDEDGSDDMDDQTVGDGRTRRRMSRVAWEKTRDGTPSRRGSAKQDIPRITREQMVLNNLDMEAIPASWFTEVHHPSDVLVRRRASSAHPSTRPTLPTTTTTTLPKRPQSETTRARLRIKSAYHSSSSSSSSSSTTVPIEDAMNGSSVLCAGGGGGGGGGGGYKYQKTETMRSRRQLMELAGAGGRRGSGRANTAADINRLKFLEAVRLERERLEARIKLFLQSCDTVGEGGISSRKEREYQSIILPHTMYG